MLRSSQSHRGSKDGRNDARFSIARLLGSERKEKSSPESVVDDEETNARQRQALEDMALRRHVRAVTMGDERPLPISAPTWSLDRHRHSADLE